MSLTTIRRTFAVALTIASMALLAPFHAVAATAPNFVYVMTNDPSGNSILVYSYSTTTGKLTQVQEISTGGLGYYTGYDPIGSQGSLTLNSTGELLLAVNAGSNQVTSFNVTSTGLTYASIASSGGTEPVSVAIYKSSAYVVNNGGTPNIAALSIGTGGILKLVAGSSRPLPGGTFAEPGQIGITPDGNEIVVTEKQTNMIDLFSRTGGAGTSVPSIGPGPFGFTFAQGYLVVTEAVNSTTSSYTVVEGTTPSLTTITASLPDEGAPSTVALACWIEVNPTGKYAYAVNFGTRSISSLTVSSTGVLALDEPEAAGVPFLDAPIDIALTHTGHYAYFISAAGGALFAYHVNSGVLAKVEEITGLPTTMQGIAAW